PAPAQAMEPPGLAGKPADRKLMLEEMPRLEAEQARMFKRRAGAERDMRLRQQVAQSRVALPPLVVREYAHFRTHGAGAERRNDGSETVYWNPVFVLADGKGEASFELSDQVTSFEVTAFGHTLDGRLGAITSTIESRLPLTLEAKTPIEVT